MTETQPCVTDEYTISSKKQHQYQLLEQDYIY